MAASTVLAIELVAEAFPTAEPLVAIETCPAPTPIDEASVLVTFTPDAETLERLTMPARTVPVIELLTVEPAWAEVDPPLPPAATTVTGESESAVTDTVPDAFTVELLMLAATVLWIVLDAVAAPTALPLVAIATWPEPTSIVEVLLLPTFTIGAVIAGLFKIVAVVALLTALLTTEPAWLAEPAPLPPVATAVIRE